jgi:hypothetical protein
MALLSERFVCTKGRILKESIDAEMVSFSTEKLPFLAEKSAFQAEKQTF